jgi:galactokinase
MEKEPHHQLRQGGRLCLFGEHSDWAAGFGLHRGYCIVVGTDQGMDADAWAADEFRVETRLASESDQGGQRSRLMYCDWEDETLLASARDEGEFFRYCAAVAYEMKTRLGVGGLHLKITANDLPLRKGVSSSAAVCILVAKAFDAAYQLGLFPHELMDLAYRGELLTGSQCGRMDQACIYGKTPVLLTFEKGHDPRVEPLRGGRELDLFFVDLAGAKNTVRILADLNAAYLRNTSLQDALGKRNDQLVRRAYRAIVDGDAQTVGALMTESQLMFDRDVAPHSPEELASPRLLDLLALDTLAPHIYVGKGVGSQGDGTAQFIARTAADRTAAIAAIRSAFPEMHCFPLPLGK